MQAIFIPVLLLLVALSPAQPAQWCTPTTFCPGLMKCCSPTTCCPYATQCCYGGLYCCSWGLSSQNSPNPASALKALIAEIKPKKADPGALTA